MHRSLSARLSFWIVLAAAVLFFGMIVYLSRLWRTSIHAEAEKDAVQVLDNTEMRVDEILDDVCGAADVVSWFVERDIAKPDQMVVYSNQAVLHNTILNSCSISFEPNYYRQKGTYYSIFTWRTPEGSVAWEQEGDDDYRYFDIVWYRLPKQLGHACWTEPYSDHLEDDDPGMDTEMLISYCKPFFGPDSVFAGVVSLDLSLKWLSERLYDIKPYPNAYCMLVARDGTYLVHPDSGKLFYHSILSDAEEKSDASLKALGIAMTSQETGMSQIDLNGELNYVFYRPIPETGWSVAIVCPDSDIYGEYNKLRRNMIWNMLLALLMLFLLFVFLIRRELAPLGKLAEEADYIASGDFARSVPATDRKDEIGMLSKSFEHMQSSLVQHIQELTSSTASRERMERELQIARNIQMGMVPHNFDLGASIDLYALMRAAREVGGDLYDFFIQDEKLYLCIGDVSGKGVPASLIMAVSRGMFRIVARQNMPPAEIACRINDTFSEKNDQMIFVTMFIATVDLKSGVMDYCNCGHNAPVLFPSSGGKPVFLDCVPNTAVGILPGFAYQGQQIDLRDQVLFLYTDGLNEAENDAHEQFGNERMLAELGAEKFQDAKTTVSRLSQAVDVHVSGAMASDDLTMLCLKVNL